jgi:four helix bundle protein
VTQLNHGALSILANIAEANGRFTKFGHPNFFGIARCSVQEFGPLLELAQHGRLLTPEEHTSLKKSLEEIARMLSGLINGLDNRDGRFGQRELRSAMAWLGTMTSAEFIGPINVS